MNFNCLSYTEPSCLVAFVWRERNIQHRIFFANKITMKYSLRKFKSSNLIACAILPRKDDMIQFHRNVIFPRDGFQKARTPFRPFKIVLSEEFCE